MRSRVQVSYGVCRSLVEISVSELNGTSQRTFLDRSDNITMPFALAVDSLSRFVMKPYIEVVCFTEGKQLSSLK